jgi:DNA invertase Pin-like site-specific DNA recombinase
VQRLKAEGCEPIFTDQVTGTKSSRPGWDKCLATLKRGDTLMVTKLDRIGRSLINVVDVVTALHERGVQIRCLDQGEIDTTSPTGDLVFKIMAALAEWEAAMARERTREGLEAAKVRHGGTLPVRGPSIKRSQIESAEHLARTTDWSSARIAESIGVSRATLYRHVDIARLRAATH